MSHSLGDGVPLIRVVREVLCENLNELEPIWMTEESKDEKSHLQKVMASLLGLLKFIGLAVLTPHMLVMEATKSPASNILRPPKFTGEKVISWVHESDSDVPLFQTLRETRRKFTGTRYNEVVAAVVARGLKSYFEAKAIAADELPKQINISIPEQVEHPGMNEARALPCPIYHQFVILLFLL